MKQFLVRIPAILLLIYVSVHLWAEVEASSYAQPAYRYFQAGDYDAAWLFYQRAMINGMDDGRSLFRAAESFRKQKIPPPNEILQTRLYSVARYWVQKQYPGSPLISQTERYYNPESLVNRSYIRQTYAMVGAPLPASQTYSTEVSRIYDSLRESVMSRFRQLGELSRIIRVGGLRKAWEWAFLPTNQVFSTIIVLYAFVGILLPAVLAFVVARSGRKSYVAAYLFLLLWGPLGVHRFYIGRYTSGVLWLLTGGLVGIGVFFDLFLLGEYVHFWNEENKGRAFSTTAKPRSWVRKPKKSGGRKSRKKLMGKPQLQREKKIKAKSVRKAQGKKAKKRESSSPVPETTNIPDVQNEDIDDFLTEDFGDSFEEKDGFDDEGDTRGVEHEIQSLD